jgi:hypothetical protein
MTEEFKIQSYRIVDLPTYITCNVLKHIQYDVKVWETFLALMGADKTNNNTGNYMWFLEICSDTNMTLHDIIGHMKRSGDSGAVKRRLGEVVDQIRNSHQYQLEKRIEILEAKIASN